MDKKIVYQILIMKIPIFNNIYTHLFSSLYLPSEILSFVTPTLNPLYRVNQLIHAPLNVLTEGNIPFTGTLGVRVWQKDSTDITSGTGEYLLQEGQGGNITVSFILITPGSYSIQFKAANNISNVVTTKLLSVASEYVDTCTYTYSVTL